MKTKKEEDEQSITEICLDDPFLTAVFLQINYLIPGSFTIDPYFKGPKMVSWRIRGNGVLEVLERIYSDEKIPISTYIRAVREVRNQMFVLKSASVNKP